jgi:co-chaperonin GroES (HSP10)
MNTLQRYKPIPPLEKLNPGYDAGWKYDVLILQAVPEDTTAGGIIISESTKGDELGASVVARIVAMSPTAFRHDDWLSVSGGVLPYKVGDIILTKRYPAGCRVVGADGRNYLMVKDEEIIGLRSESAWEQANERAA